MNPRFAAAPLR